MLEQAMATLVYNRSLSGHCRVTYPDK